MLTIYSIGDPWYLGKVMDAIAMISGHNAGFVGASAVAALIGVFIVMFSTVIKMQGLNIHHLLICYVMYMGCFSTTTDVAIESVYGDKAVIQKDNVPYGPAVIGSIISTIGYGLTQKMEMAFSDTSPLTEGKGNDGGYANPLYLINNLANWAENGQMLKDIENTNAGKQFARNYMTYVKECTTKAIYLGPTYSGKTFDEVFNLPQNDDIAFQSDLYSTELINPTTGQAQSVSCKDGISLLKTQFAYALAEFESNTENLVALYQKLGKCTTTTECKTIISAGNFTETIQDSLENLRIGHYTAQSVMYAGLTDSLKKTGLGYGYAHYKDQQAATMLFQAVQQRNVQWASEANMFLNSFKPMMSFIEGFFYAISPFAAIIMLLGLFGLNIFFKYLILLIWIQLWMPIMAIANMFIITSARELLYNEGVAATTKAGTNLSSISTYMYEDLVAVTQDKIAVASIMLASTPVLALMLLTGSVYAFTSLTGKLAGADHANEKLVAPDIASPAALMSMQSMVNADAMKYIRSGITEDRTSLGLGVSQALRTSEQNMLSAQDQLATSLSHAIRETGSSGNSYNMNGAIQRMYSGGYEKDWTNAVNRVQAIGEKQDKSFGAEAAATVTMALSTVGKFLPGASAVAQIAGKFGFSETQRNVFEKALTGSDALSNSERAKLSSIVAGGLTEGYGTNDSYIKAGDFNRQVQEQNAKLVSSTNAHEEAYTAQQLYDSKVGMTDSEAISQAGIGAVNTILGKAEQSLSDQNRELYNKAYKNLREQYGDVPLGSNEDSLYKLMALRQADKNAGAIASAQLVNATGRGGGKFDVSAAYSKATNNDIEKAHGYNPELGDSITKEANDQIGASKENSTYHTPQEMEWLAETSAGNAASDAKVSFNKGNDAMNARIGKDLADKNKHDISNTTQNNPVDFTKRGVGDFKYTGSPSISGNSDLNYSNYKSSFQSKKDFAYNKSFNEFKEAEGVGTQVAMVQSAREVFSTGMAVKSMVQEANLSYDQGNITEAERDSIIAYAQDQYNTSFGAFKDRTKTHGKAIGEANVDKYVMFEGNLIGEAIEGGSAGTYTTPLSNKNFSSLRHIK